MFFLERFVFPPCYNSFAKIAAFRFLHYICGGKFLYIRKFISAYTKKDFRICENFRPCARKKFSVREAKNRRAHAGKFPCARKYFFVRTEIYFCAHGNFAPCPQKPTHSGRDEGHPSPRDQEQVPPKARRGHGRGEVCRYSWGGEPP